MAAKSWLTDPMRNRGVAFTEAHTSVCLAGGQLLVTSAAVGLEAPGEHDGAVLRTPAPVDGSVTDHATLE
jgi:hypothetical protein